MAKTVTLNPINPITFEYQDYSNQDDNLIVNFTIEPTFDPLQNYVTSFIYNLNNEVISSNEINFKGYSIIDNQVVLNPELDIENAGLEEGQYNIVYNFINNELSSSYFQRLYIDQISTDRTEVRLNTTQIPNLNLIEGANSLISQIQSNPGTYFDFFLDFGNNQLIIANNMLLDTSNLEDPTVLVKLYEPLPLNFSVKDECWVVTEVADSVAYNININQVFDLTEDNVYLKGPNLNLSVKDQINNSTDYTTYSTLTSSSYATGSTNLQYQINSLLAERGIEINVDYNNYSNFIYFSSALTRLENFYYKLQLIEEYQYSSSLTNPIVPSDQYSSNSKNIYQSKIDEIITTFDGYDYFLYFESGSYSWPKTNSTYPYTNVSVGSVTGYDWFVTQSISASAFDSDNTNALINSVPAYLRDDSNNAEYELFIEMLSQMFDNIWIYYQDVTNKFNADNRLDYGVSKDLVADVLRDLGLKIYQNSFSSTDLYAAFLGVTPSGSSFPFSYMTGSLPTPTGYEYINSSISASNEAVPLENIEKGTYKRLYHNLPLLLKKKGTTTGLQDLVTVYGIPSTILRVAEFGGKDKVETNDWDYYKQRYNNKYDTLTSGFISSSWVLNSNWQQTTPSTVQFRFKLPASGSTGAVDNAVNYPSQSLWHLDTDVKLVLEYTGSGFTSGSYSGSILDPYYQYGTLKVIPDAVNNPNQSASIYLPFFNGEWWSVMTTINSDVVSIYAGDNIYNGDDGSQLGFYASSSVSSVDDTEWLNGTTSYFATASTGYTSFSGSLQEIRYYDVVLEENNFKDFIMNPDSIEGNGINSGSEQLIFRASLGGELYTGSDSIHPKVTGSWESTSSFTSDSSFYTGSGVYSSNIETVYLDQPPVGIKNIVSNKIQIANLNLPSGDTLSQYRSIQQQPAGGNTYTENLAYTEIAFSPQNEINDDIMDSIGFFNIGEYIGDPRQRFTQAESYPDLDKLRNAYFEKYKNNYNLNDYIRLIKFFDNSLFKMIKDFTPARSSLASGVVVKQHLLERNKYPQPSVTQSIYDYSGSIDTAFISGGAGGSVNNLNSLYTNPYYLNNEYGVTQSWDETIVIPSGVVTQTHSSQDEFYNGEYSGSEFVVENGELNTSCDLYKNPSTQDILYNVSGNFIPTFQGFVNQQPLVQGPGEIHIWWEQTIINRRDYSPGYFDYVWSPAALTISKISANGVNLEDYIPNALEYILQTAYVSGDVTLSGWTPSFFPSYNLGNFDLKISNIQEIDSSLSGTGYYIVQLLPNPYNITVLTDQSAGTVSSIANKSSVVSVIEPFVPIGFYNSSCNPLINNSEVNRLSQWYKQIDYATAQTTPVNFAQLISGSATPAAVQDSNYTSIRNIRPRYNGSKNTTDGFNTASITEAVSLENSENVNLQPTTLGYPSVDKLDASILEFNWGGGTFPQIIDGGVLSLQDLLLVGDDRNKVSLYPSQQPYFLDTVNLTYPIGSSPVFQQYNTNVTTTAGSIIGGYNLITPERSLYYIPSGSLLYGGATANLASPGELFFSILGNPGLSTVINGFETATLGSGSSYELYLNLSSSIAKGDDIYVSMYYNLGTTASESLVPVSSSFNYNLDIPSLNTKGVYKMSDITFTGAIVTASLDNFKGDNLDFGNASNPGNINAGLLIWRGTTGNYMFIENATLSGLGKGGLISSTPSPTIENNFTYITQEYGINPKNS